MIRYKVSNYLVWRELLPFLKFLTRIQDVDSSRCKFEDYFVRSLSILINLNWIKPEIDLMNSLLDVIYIKFCRR